MTIIAAADGSALGNPGPAGWGWYVDPSCWASGGWPHGTNNMGELTAVLDLLQRTSDMDEDLEVLCDSKYAIDTITKWMAGWKKKGWKKSDGKPVANLEIVKALDVAMRERRGRVTFTWVKGHAGHHLNEEADRIANAASSAYKEGREPDRGPGFGDAADPIKGAARVEEPNGPLEDDLFSALEDEVVDPVDEVIAYERALLSDEVRGDAVTLASHLHEDWSLVGDSGQIWTRRDWLEKVGPAGEVEMEVLKADRVDADTVLVVWRGHDRHGSAVHSTWWVRPARQSGAGWVQRFHHVSRTSG